MYQINLYKNLDRLSSIMKVYYFFKVFNFFLVLDLFYFTNKSLLDLKIELNKVNSKSLILNTKVLKNLFVFKDNKFCNTKTLVIFSNHINLFVQVMKFLDQKPFYFCYRRYLSSIFSRKTILK